MLYIVHGLFSRPQDAQRVFDQLVQLGFRMDQLAFRSRFASKDEYEAFQVMTAHEDIGAALLTERMMNSLPATGLNLAGNSSLASTRLGEIGRLLDDVAHLKVRPALRIDLLVTSLDAMTADRVQRLLESSGALSVRRKAAPKR